MKCKGYCIIDTEILEGNKCHMVVEIELVKSVENFIIK